MHFFKRTFTSSLLFPIALLLGVGLFCKSAKAQPSASLLRFVEHSPSPESEGFPTFTETCNFKLSAKTGFQALGRKERQGSKIKEIRCSDAGGSPVALFTYQEDSRKTQEVRWDYSGRYFFDRIVEKISFDPLTREYLYYRKDSLHQRVLWKYYNVECPVMDCSYADVDRWVSGDFLNRQNRFYREHYYQVPVYTYGGRNPDLNGQEYYLDTLYTSNYAKDSLFAYASIRGCFSSGDYCCDCQKKQTWHLPEAAYREPDLGVDPPDCGSREEEPPSVTYEELKDDRGRLVAVYRIDHKYQAFDHIIEDSKEGEDLPEAPPGVWYKEISRERNLAFRIEYSYFD